MKICFANFRIEFFNILNYQIFYPDPLPPLVNWPASNSVSLSIKMSPSWMGPFTFLLNILFWSLPAMTLHLICIASPLAPVLPIISSTFAGVANEKLTEPLACSSRPSSLLGLLTWPLGSSFRCFVGSSFAILLHFVAYLFYQLLGLAFLDDNNASCRNFNSCCCSQFFLARNLHARHSLFFSEN